MATNSSSQNKATTMAELMARSTSKGHGLQKGAIVEGTIKKLTAKEILLDIGAKGDALVIEYDKTNLNNLLAFLKVGDKVKASVISPESEEGFPVVSLRRLLDELIFENLKTILNDKKPIKVHITEMPTKGGYFAETKDGIKGFLPNSQVLPDTSISGKDIDVVIIEVERDKKRIIFSQKATVYTVDPVQIQKYIKKDDVITAIIHTVTNHGIYAIIKPQVDIQIEGFIHISEISHERVENLESKFQKGQEIKAQVLEIDTENRRVNLSLKKLAKDIFIDIKSNYPEEKRVKGKILDMKSRGITLELEEGIRGFIPSSKVPSQSTYAEGQIIEAEVTGIDEKRRLVLLSPVLTTKFVGYR